MSDRRKKIGISFACIFASSVAIAYTNNIMLTGYWPPTNEIVRQFSTNPAQNPGGWRGENWEGRGYDVYSFFPEFPTGTFPVGVGDFTVDYQDTSADFWRIVEQVRPIAIMTFSRGSTGNLWEVEWRQRNLTSWVNDYAAPFQPTPSPPDAGYAANGIRFSTLPMDNIVNAVNGAGLGLNAFVDRTSFGGGFLSEYMAYHGTWYQGLHSSPSDPFRTVAAGHIHVGTTVSVTAGTEAAKISLRETIRYVNSVVPEPSTGFAALALSLVLAMHRTNRKKRATNLRGIDTNS